MTVEKILSKLTATDGEEYYLLTSLHDDGDAGMDLALVLSDRAWTGTMTEDDLESACQLLKMDYTEFVIQTRKALTRQNVGGLDFQYTCKVRANNMHLTWKKHVSTENIKIQLGNTVLKEKENAGDVITEIFEHALEATTRLQGSITSLQADKERLMTERASAIKRLEKCVANKVQMEEDMYNKFAIVINDKKAKIRSLREQTNGGTQAVSGSGESAMVGESLATKEDSGDDTDDMAKSDSGDETDDGRGTPPPAKKSRRVMRIVSSADESLLLDESATKITTPVNPRRRRQQEAANKKVTPSKPTLPKASSSTPGTSTGRRAALRKGPSNVSSNTSSENMDNLLDDF